MTANQTDQLMIGRDTEFDAGGVRLSPSTASRRRRRPHYTKEN
jgi:hypothetical protein